ncbi:3-deoxy-manno-octulosonate cytidylyltransferase [uncultured Psychromonas sp.]|uniref:3-deoxy-manno-octulosonate cytidylyltransferase n=1 Tax=uncultured Psychromonas sp. TaxID=173974 RepID=UPI00261C35FE|nr:3-deoxy-manno-octulosonate cytidylyltransferase [uncultured Psychromonas sp.]
MENNMKYAVVIPARFQSSRFPGKPLVDICGKPMIQHVWEKCCVAVNSVDVYVATDSTEIAERVKGFGGQVVMTSSDCLTGTDRLAEANLKLDCDFLINVQGDEPVIEPSNITKIIESFKKTSNVTNAYCAITSEDEFRSLTVPKVVTTSNQKLLYMSRSAIPLSKGGDYVNAYKQVCVYAFSRDHLSFFTSSKEKTPLEKIEDIEILRFLESDIQVDMVEVESGSLAVDIPADVDKVIAYLNSK